MERHFYLTMQNRLIGFECSQPVDKGVHQDDKLNIDH